jgi:H+-translocating NAD(P) transhydrogenase subunit alpha
VRIAVLRETRPRERRVSLNPESASALTKLGMKVVVQSGAGTSASIPDEAYTAAGATVAEDAPATVAGAQVVAKVLAPTADEVATLPDGATLICLVQQDGAAVLPALAARRVTTLALERVPRITRAQSMDVLSSQATVAGYKAVLLGAAALPRLLPMLTTAAGNLAPARVFVIGAGVAGLQAIATARRLGGVVSAFDVRPAVREQIQSLGASVVASPVAAEGSGGYAREQTEEERQAILSVIGAHASTVDLVVTTAAVPGRRAPVLLTEDIVRRMKPGSVIVDLAAETGGNCALSRVGETVEAHGVTIVAPLNLPSTVPQHASQMFARNVLTLLRHMIVDGTLRVDPGDEIIGPMTLTHAGEVRNV